MIKLIFCCIILITIYAVQPQQITGLPPLKCSTNSNTNSQSVGIVLPFMDVEIRTEQRIHMLFEADQQTLYILHGQELLQLQLSRSDKRLINLGTLAARRDAKAAVVGASIVAWREYLLVAVAIAEDVIAIYQLPKAQLAQRVNDAVTGTGALLRFELVQELTLEGKFRQMHLIKPTEQQVVLLLAVNMSRHQDKYRTYEWQETYFNVLEELTVPTIQSLHVVGRHPKYIVSGRLLRAQAKLVLTVYEMDAVTLKLQQRQALSVQARHIQAFNFHRRNYLICCASASSGKCIYFRMRDGSFVVYNKRVLSDLHFKQLTADVRDQMIVAARSNGEILIFNSARLDCFNGFGSNSTQLTHTHVLHTETNETFVAFVDSRASSTVIRLAAVYTADDGAALSASLERSEDLSVVQEHRHEFEESVNRLRSLLLRRKPSLDTLHGLTAKLQQRKLNLQQPLTVQHGHIHTLRLRRPHLSTPTQLLAHIARLQRNYGQGRRRVRSFGVGNASYFNSIECVKVRRLHVENLIYKGDLLPGYHVDVAASPAILTVKHKLLTQALQTPQLVTPHKSATPTQSKPTQRTAVRNLWVQRINNVSWLSFHDSLFLKSRDSSVEGRLIMQANGAVENLSTPLLNGLVVQKLFNLKQPQTISSNMYMSAFFAWEVQAGTVNGLDFAEQIAFRSHNETLIKSPVHIYKMNVDGDMHVANITKQSRQADASTPLQQHYTGKVTLHGSLTVNSLQRDTAATRLLIAGQSVAKQDLAADFMLLRTPQHITTPVMFGYAKVTAPALSTTTLNGQPTEQHLLSGSSYVAQPADIPLFLLFADSTVAGDIVCSDFQSQLAALADNVVYQGQQNNITGIKRLRAQLTTTELRTRQINSLPVTDLLLKSQLNASMHHFSGTKGFARIEAHAAVHVRQQLYAHKLNSLLLAQLLQHDYKVDSLELRKTPNIQKLVFSRLNGLPADELLAQLTMRSNGRLQLHKQLMIHGNVRFDQPLQLQRINNVDWLAYQHRLVRNTGHTHIAGKKRFLGDVRLTKMLRTPHCNGLDLSSWLDNTLLRNTPQNISGAYTIGDLHVSNLDVGSISGVPTSAFIDMHHPHVELRGDIYAKQLLLHGNLSCPLVVDVALPKLQERLQYLRSRQWRNLVVLGDAFWQQLVQLDASHAQLAYLRKHAVTRTGEQTIIADVQLWNPHMYRMQSPQQQLPAALDFGFIAADALLRNSTLDSQRVIAPQTLLRNVVSFATLSVQQTQFEMVNSIYVERLNASLYRMPSRAPIVGPLSFVKPPIVGRLLVDGLVNGRNTTGIYQQGTTLRQPVRLSKLRVEQHLMLGEINDMSLDYLLQNRVMLEGAAMEVFDTLSFEHLVLGKQPMLVSINDLLLDNVVYKHGSKMQAITGAKSVPQGVLLEGPAHVMWLNGKDLSDSYQQSIFTDKTYIIDSLVIGQATFQGGLLQLRQAARSVQEEQPEAIADQPETIAKQLRQLELLAKKRHPAQLLYLDYEPQAVNVSMNNANATYELSVDMPLHMANCRRSFKRAQLSTRLRLLQLSNVTADDVLQAATPSLRVKAKNHCGTQSQQTWSKISIDCRQQTQNLGIKKQVKALRLLDTALANRTLLLLLLHGMGGANELRVLAINASNCSISDWQSLATAAGSLLQPLQLGNRTLLLTSSLQEQLLPALAVYQLQPSSGQFALQQQIYGDYDLAELVQLATHTDSAYQLLLSCHRCQHISVHSYDAGAQKFVPLQQLRLGERVQALQTFSLAGEQDARYLLVLTTPGSEYYYIFGYAHIEGWVQKYYGFLADVQWTWPLLDSGEPATAADTPLLLLCSEHRCGLVRTLLA